MPTCLSPHPSGGLVLLSESYPFCDYIYNIICYGAEAWILEIRYLEGRCLSLRLRHHVCANAIIAMSSV